LHRRPRMRRSDRMDEDGSRFETRRKPKVERRADWYGALSVRERASICFSFVSIGLHSRPFAVAIRGANSTQRRIQVIVGRARMWAE